METAPSDNGFKPMDGSSYVPPAMVGKLVKEFMIKQGNTVTIHEVRAELSAAGISGYAEKSFDKWYERLFVMKEPEPTVSPMTAEESKEAVRPAPATPPPAPPHRLMGFLAFVDAVEQIGGIDVAKRYLEALEKLEPQLP